MNRRGPAWMLAAACVWCAGGCANWRQAPLQATAGIYDRATLRYESDAAAQGVALPVARVDRSQVTYEALPTVPIHGQCRSTLLVEYPHPDGRAGMAQATVELTAAAPRLNPTGEVKLADQARNWWRKTWPGQQSESEVYEKWVLDVPRAQLDQALDRLNQAGYFDGGLEASQPGVDLAVTLSGKKTDKTWRSVPELEALAQQARLQGQLVAYRRSGNLPGGTLMPTTPQLAQASPGVLRAGSQFTAARPVLAAAAPVRLPPVAVIAPPARNVQPVNYLSPVAASSAPLTPPEYPLAPQTVQGVARLPSPPAAIWR